MVKVAVVTIIETDDPRIITQPEGMEGLARTIGAIGEVLRGDVGRVIAILPAQQGELMVKAHLEVMRRWDGVETAAKPGRVH
jgi:hypothetical protein